MGQFIDSTTSCSCSMGQFIVSITNCSMGQFIVSIAKCSMGQFIVSIANCSMGQFIVSTTNNVEWVNLLFLQLIMFNGSIYCFYN